MDIIIASCYIVAGAEPNTISQRECPNVESPGAHERRFFRRNKKSISKCLPEIN